MFTERNNKIGLNKGDMRYVAQLLHMPSAWLIVLWTLSALMLTLVLTLILTLPSLLLSR